MTRPSQALRILPAVQADLARTSDLAHDLWCKAQSLAVQPEGCLALPHVRQSLIEAREAIDAMLARREPLNPVTPE